MTEQSGNPIQRLELVDAARLQFDTEGHVRSEPADSDDLLTENIAKNGIIEAVHVRVNDGDYLVFDGWRRVQAALEAGIQVPALIHEEYGRSEALSASLLRNNHDGFADKSVSGDDRNRSLDRLADEMDTTVTGTLDQLCLAPETELLARRLRPVKGVGDTVVAALVDHFDTHKEVETATEAELQAVDGVGDVIAGRIYRHFDRDGTEVVVCD